MENAISQRIKQVLKIKKITNRALAKSLNMQETTLNSKLNGQSRIDINTFCVINDVLSDISTEWLLTGRGDMLRRNEVAAKNSSASVFGDSIHHNTGNVATRGAHITTTDTDKDRLIASLQDQIAAIQAQNASLTQIILNLTKNQ